MSASSQSRCLFAYAAAPARSCLRRKFHSSPIRSRPAPKYPSIKAPIRNVASNLSRGQFQPYSEAERAALSKKYTPAQMAAIEAGEEAVHPQDLANQATIREDTFGLQYIDDLSTIHHLVDKPVRAPESNYDPNLRFRTEDEIAEDFVHWARNIAPNASEAESVEYLTKMRLTVGKEEAERNPPSYLAPAIPKVDSLAPQLSPDAEGKEDLDPGLIRLMRQTGFSRDEIRRFRVKNLVVHRVVNQTRLGKIQSMYYLSIAGNGRGLLGIGEGKATEPEDAKKQAQYAAIRNLQPIQRYEDRTIYGDVKGKVGATELELMTRPPGIHCNSLPLRDFHTDKAHRLRYSMSIPHIWDMSLCRHSRLGCTSHTFSERNEYYQSNRPGFAKPTSTRRRGEGTGKEAGRCTKGVLWGIHMTL